jgi:hypothetical protein
MNFIKFDKIKQMLNYRVCTLKFKKSYQYVDWGVWNEVKDSYLLQVLLEMQSKYDFEIVSTNFHDCFQNSYIVIKCKKEDKYNIFSGYCLRLEGKITEISF